MTADTGPPKVTEASRAFNEMNSDGHVRPAYAGIGEWIAKHRLPALAAERAEA